MLKIILFIIFKFVILKPCLKFCKCRDLSIFCSKKDLDVFPRLFPNLIKIDLSYNKIESLSDSTLLPYSKLRSLNMKHNNLMTMPNLKYNLHLQEIVLSHNHISFIPQDTFSNLFHLTYLDISHNNITGILSNSFTLVNPINTLLLDNNMIKSLHSSVFDQLQSLQKLKLNKNKISYLPSDLFQNNTRLKYLDLNKNHLSTVESLTFSKLDNLEVLKLKHNNIQYFKDGCFWGLNNIRTLQLDYNFIQRITNQWLFGLGNLKYLSLSHNQIWNMEYKDWRSCQLLELDLSHNNLTSLPFEAFYFLQQLQRLDLNHNQIISINEYSFKSLKQLLQLDLSHNTLSTTFEEASEPQFQDLVSLKSLSLAHNFIKTISYSMFNSLHRLQELDLSGNEIVSIQNDSFNLLKALQKIEISSNSFLCDCNLIWLNDWIHSKSKLVSNFVSNFENTSCAYPKSFNGLPILHADVSSFSCKKLYKPKILREPVPEFSALSGKKWNLTCSAVISNDANLKITWKKDGGEMHLLDAIYLLENANINLGSSDDMDNDYYSNHNYYTSLKKERIDKNGTELIKLTTFLIQPYAQEIDDGSYQCIFSNELGASYSRKAQVNINVSPFFTVRPRDISVKKGSTAKLECGAAGKPSPSISWLKDNSKEIPAARQQRMGVMSPQNHIFYIVKTKLADSGIYTCVAKNSAGTSMANASLIIHDIPKFKKGLNDLTVTLGESIVLDCTIFDALNFKVDWYINGKKLASLLEDSFILTSQRQVLVIRSIQMQDTGKYTCVVTNPLYAIRNTATIKVIQKAQLFSNPKVMIAVVMTSILFGLLIASLCILYFCIYHVKKRKRIQQTTTTLSPLPFSRSAFTDRNHPPMHHSFFVSVPFCKNFYATSSIPGYLQHSKLREQIPVDQKYDHCSHQYSGYLDPPFSTKINNAYAQNLVLNSTDNDDNVILSSRLDNFNKTENSEQIPKNLKIPIETNPTLSRYQLAFSKIKSHFANPFQKKSILQKVNSSTATPSSSSLSVNSLSSSFIFSKNLTADSQKFNQIFSNHSHENDSMKEKN